MIELIKQKEFRSADSEYHSHYQLIPWITDLFDTCSNKAGFPDSSVGKESACDAGYPSSIPGSGRSPGEGIGYPLQYSWVSLVAQMVKNLSTLWETLVWSLAWEDPLRRAWQPTPVFLPGESPWTKEPGGLQSMGSQRVRHNWATKHSTYYLILTQ